MDEKFQLDRQAIIKLKEARRETNRLKRELQESRDEVERVRKEYNVYAKSERVMKLESVIEK
jgi:hypothetical protein